MLGASRRDGNKLIKAIGQAKGRLSLNRFPSSRVSRSGDSTNPILLTAQQSQLPQQIATGIVANDSERATAAGQIEFVFRHICNYKVGSTAVVIEAVADVGELLKRERAIVLKPKFNVLVGRKLAARHV